MERTMHLSIYAAKHQFGRDARESKSSHSTIMRGYLRRQVGLNSKFEAFSREQNGVQKSRNSKT
jgi:hypothetical protein